MANDISSLLVAIIIVTVWTIALINEFNGRLSIVFSAIVESVAYILSMIGMITVLSVIL